MAKLPKIEISKVYLVFFPIATYARIGDACIFKVFGIPVYKRLSEQRKFLWIKWTERDECDCSNCRYTREFGGFMVCLNRKSVPMPECKPPRAG